MTRVTPSWRNRSDVSGSQLCCETRHREPPPHGRLVVQTSRAESKLIQVLVSRRRMRRDWNASQTHRWSFVSEASPSLESSESDKLHPEQLTGAFKFPDVGTLRRIVKYDETDYRAHLLRGNRSRSPPRRVSVLSGRPSKFPREIFIRPSRGATVESPSSRGWICKWRRLESACLHKINQKMPVPRRTTCSPKLLSKHFGEIKFFSEITVACVIWCETKIMLPFTFSQWKTVKLFLNAAVWFAINICI